MRGVWQAVHEEAKPQQTFQRDSSQDSAQLSILFVIIQPKGLVGKAHPQEASESTQQRKVEHFSSTHTDSVFVLLCSILYIR